MKQFEKCEKCGGAIEYRQIDSVQGLFCKSYNWSLVTTCDPELDETKYCVCLLNADYKNSKHISAIASAFGNRYLDVRKLLQQEKPRVFEGEALQILKAKPILESAGLRYEIIPEFNYFKK